MTEEAESEDLGEDSSITLSEVAKAVKKLPGDLTIFALRC